VTKFISICRMGEETGFDSDARSLAWNIVLPFPAVVYTYLLACNRVNIERTNFQKAKMIYSLQCTLYDGI